MHISTKQNISAHDDVVKWKRFPRNWPFVRGIHRSPVNSPHKGQLRGTLMFSLICVWINDWVNNREAGDLRRYRAHHCHASWIKYLRRGSALPLPVPYMYSRHGLWGTSVDFYTMGSHQEDCPQMLESTSDKLFLKQDIAVTSRSYM